MKHLRGKIAFGVLAISASFFATGCNQSSDAASPTSANGSAANPNMDNSALGGNQKYTDISADEAKTARPLDLLGRGPMAHAEPGMLSALKSSYLDRGTPLRASQLELSYDFNSGDYKGDPKLLSLKSTGLAKGASTAAWNGIFSYRGYFNGVWQGWVGNGEWIGNPNGIYNQGTLMGWNIQTDVVNGVTPSIYWEMYWYGYGWTSTYSWNQLGQSNSYYWRGFTADTKTSGYHICYEMLFSGLNVESDIWGCGGTKIAQLDQTGFQTKADPIAMRFMIVREPDQVFYPSY